jgi:hypothetical protein
LNSNASKGNVAIIKCKLMNERETIIASYYASQDETKMIEDLTFLVETLQIIASDHTPIIIDMPKYSSK